MNGEGMKAALRWLLAVAALAAAASAQAAGDLWSDRTVIVSLPYSDTANTSGATEEGNDPVLNCFVGAAASEGVPTGVADGDAARGAGSARAGAARWGATASHVGAIQR